MFNKISIFKKKPKISRIPKHIAITIEDNQIWEKKHKKTAVDSYFKRDLNIFDIINLQVKLKIPIITLLLLPEKSVGVDELVELDSIVKFFQNLSKNPIIDNNQIKVSVLGKWYGLSGSLVDSIKHIIDQTKTHDRFFLNICVNYNGQQEIVDACKLIARNIKAGRVEINSINKEMIKENLYSSYFLEPDIIIKSGLRKNWSDLLLWDSASAYYYFPKKVFNDFTPETIYKGIENYGKYS